MLKLKKIQLLGFKSFCERTEISLPGDGIAVVVGPNGCGKSNILDGVSWVLGEQSAKTLRGGHMQDVIFAGTRNRKALGMAEVTLTLVDPEAYKGPVFDEPEVVEEAEDTDWDEEKLKQQKAAEVEEIIAETQPGQVLEEGEQATPVTAVAPTPIDGSAPAAAGPVVLKIRRRKFARTPRQGEIVVTRRLFRTGESEYLLNGKLCRLRDIQDIFMGTGLGPESYAIIGQERIGQLLSSKPHDRRSIIEEAAGITRFKTKKRLAELRLESAKQNLARVNDIFEEVTRQMGSLKRQASKAERFGSLRDELKSRLRVVLANRLHQMSEEHAALEAEISTLNTQIEEQSALVEKLEAEQHTATARGYELEQEAKEAQATAGTTAVEMERSTSRQRANVERIQDLVSRHAAGQGELEQAKQQIATLAEERQQNRSFLETAAQETATVRAEATQLQQNARAAGQLVYEAEQRLETQRRHTIQVLQQAGIARNQASQAEESLAALEREAERLGNEITAAHQESEHLSAERGQVSERFASATETLKQLEGEIADIQQQLTERKAKESEAKRLNDQLRAEVATVTGRRNSLDGVIREHSYSSDTVRKLLKGSSAGAAMSAVGTLADYLELTGEHEGVIDEFLREELSYIVVKSWDAADGGMHLLKNGVDGRATFLVHPEFSGVSYTEQYRNASLASVEGLVPLKDCIRVLNGFGQSLEKMLPRLRNGYVARDTQQARSLALAHPDAYFLSPDGECFHNATVTGGRASAEGPLALKRELRAVADKLAELERALAESELQVAEHGKQLILLASQLEDMMNRRRNAEQESANQGAALRQMDAEVQRLTRRLEEWLQQQQRNKDAREQKQILMEQKRTEAAENEARHRESEEHMGALQTAVDERRAQRDAAQQEGAAVSATLAGLIERQRGAETACARIDGLYADVERRVRQLEQQLAASVAEQSQREQENVQLAEQMIQLAATRTDAEARVKALSLEATALRRQLTEMESQLKTLRVAIDELRDTRSVRQSAAAKLESDQEYLFGQCVAELSVEAPELMADESLARLEPEVLLAEDEACKAIKLKLEQMGPVNMMALDEYKETAERHLFLETQRKDLLDSIENTQNSIKEIDQIARTRFEEAFVKINERFTATFGQLFNGGNAYMKLTDEENQAESGIDIVASPPGKRLQNVLLLSGGEKALTALSLLVGIFQYSPSPFCVLDEVDAPLDETNVGRLSDLLRSMSQNTQFLMVTHSKRMMQSTDLIYGVTMQEPGVSKVVSVKIGNRERESERLQASA
jgi:chromosome segregation protein